MFVEYFSCLSRKSLKLKQDLFSMLFNICGSNVHSFISLFNIFLLISVLNLDLFFLLGVLLYFSWLIFTIFFDFSFILGAKYVSLLSASIEAFNFIIFSFFWNCISSNLSCIGLLLSYSLFDLSNIVSSLT